MWFSDKWNYIALNPELSFWIKKDYALSGAVFGNIIGNVESMVKELKGIFGIIEE